MGDSLSTTDQETVTMLAYQPFSPIHPSSIGVMTGGVVSEFASANDVSSIAKITASDIAIEIFCFIVLLLYQLSPFW
jgi:hypothetical protein